MVKIRILFIDARGDLGGGSNHLLAILESLDPKKFEAFVAAPSGQPNTDRFKKHAKAFCHIPFRKFSLDAFRDLINFAEENQVHFIHSHGRGAGIYSRLLSYKTKIPTVHTFHGISYGFLGAWIDRRLKSQTARFIHVSDSEREYAQDLEVSAKDRSATIHNGINYRKFQTNQSRENAKQTLHLSPNDFVVSCVARFDPCKRHQDLVEAVALLSNRYPNLKLVLVGTGIRESTIKQLTQDLEISDRVIFLGEQNDPRSVYAASDAFVLPSEFEGLPLTPLEAMASGCAVILSNVRGNRDVVQDEKDGLLFQVGNSEALAAAIERLIGSRELRSRLVESAHRTVIEQFSIDRMCAQTQNFYESLVPLPEFRKVALTHDWLFHMRGGEKVLEAIGSLFPLAPIFTLFVKHSGLTASLRQHQIISSWLDKIPFIDRFYRYMLPLFPFVMRQFDTKNYNLIISSNHCTAKSIQKGRRAIHVCYCHAPMRYAWGFESEYFGKFPIFLRQPIKVILGRLRKLDLESNESVNFFVANSRNIKNRIAEFYRRSAEVVCPPIQARLENMQQNSADFFLVVSAFVPYKRIDIVVDAFNSLELPLTVIGSGPLLESMRRQAKPNIRFLGWQPDHEVAKHYASCKALIFPTEEDFGMVPLEAMMYGKPVIAFGRGGALETVLEPKTGIFFPEQSSESLRNAVNRFAAMSFDSEIIKEHALRFRQEVFVKKFESFLINTVATHAQKK